MASDDILILDSGAEIYIWIGEGSNEEEKNNALVTAQVIVAYCYKKGGYTVQHAGGINYFSQYICLNYTNGVRNLQKLAPLTYMSGNS